MTTESPVEIEERSRSIARRLVPGDSPEDLIRQRCVIATADPIFARLLEFKNRPVEAGIQAVQEGRPIFTDIRMVQAGIKKICQVECALDYTPDQPGTTRTSAGFRALGERLENAIVVIGNAPSAAFEVHHLAIEGIRPALVIATPVGFVNASLSKERIRELEVPSITTRGRRGGTPVAVAAMNEIITQAASSEDW